LYLERAPFRDARWTRHLERLPVVLGGNDLPRLAARRYLQRDHDHPGRRGRRRRFRRRGLRRRRDLGRDLRRRRRRRPPVLGLRVGVVLLGMHHAPVRLAFAPPEVGVGPAQPRALRAGGGAGAHACRASRLESAPPEGRPARGCCAPLLDHRTARGSPARGRSKAARLCRESEGPGLERRAASRAIPIDGLPQGSRVYREGTPRSTRCQMHHAPQPCQCGIRDAGTSPH